MTPEEAQKIISRCQDNPEWFFSNMMNLPTFEYEGKKHTHWSKQIDIANHVRDFEDTYVKSGHGIGKCLKKDTEVLMFNGDIKKVQDISKDDLVMGADSKPRKVVGLNHGYSDLYKVKYYDGSFYVVNKDHILSLVASNTKGRQKTGDITNVSVKDYLNWGSNKKRTNIGYKVSVEYPEKDLLIDPYILGVWLGDGNERRPEITNTDHEVLLAWKNEARKRKLFIKKSGDITYYISSSRDQSIDNTLLHDMQKYDLIKNKHIPHIYKISSKQQRLELLAGILDTDGYYNKSNYEITQKRKGLAYSILRLAQSVGHHATIKKVKKHCFYRGEKREGIYYRVGITRNLNQIPCRVSRKKSKVVNPQRNNLHFKISVEHEGEDEYYGFELEGKDRLFVLGDYTVTHNSMVSASIVLWFLFSHPKAIVITSAPTARQVKEVLWKEIATQWDKDLIGGELTTLKLEIDDDWKALGFTARESVDQEKMATRMQGFHSPHILVVFDEGAGVPPAFWLAKEGLMTGGHARFLTIGNPTSSTGPFYDGCLKHKAMTISCLDHPNVISGEEIIPGAVTRKWVEAKKEEWGEDSSLYKSRVLGEFPDEGDDTLIPLSKVMKAVNRDKFTEASNERKAIGVDVARFGCFDNKTEILTNDGWKLFKDLSGKEQILTLNNDNAEWGDITKIHKYRYKGLLNLYERRRVNFCITDNHKLLVRNNPKSKRYKLERYNKLPKYFNVKLTNSWTGSNPEYIEFISNVSMPNGGEKIKKWKFDYMDWAKFLGWFVSEGCVYREKRDNGRLRILIAQKTPDKNILIEKLLDKMEIKYRYESGSFEFSNNEIGKYLLEHSGKGASNKKIPKEIKEATPEVILAFLDTYRLGDGSITGSGSHIYTTTSTQLRDDLQEVLCKLGIAGKWTLTKKRGSRFFIDDREVKRKHDVYTVFSRQKSSDAEIKKKHVKKVEYDDFVYCVSTSTKKIMVRRNGCVMWSGNSDYTVITLKHGRNVVKKVKYNGKDLNWTINTIKSLDKEFKSTCIVIDDTGLGGGITDAMKDWKRTSDGGEPQIIPINFGSSPEGNFDNIEFENIKAEIFWQLKIDFQQEHITIEDEGCIVSELTSLKYGYNNDKLKIVSKKDMKKAGLKSPDEADSLALANYGTKKKFNITKIWEEISGPQTISGDLYNQKF